MLEALTQMSAAAAAPNAVPTASPAPSIHRGISDATTIPATAAQLAALGRPVTYMHVPCVVEYSNYRLESMVTWDIGLNHACMHVAILSYFIMDDCEFGSGDIASP